MTYTYSSSNGTLTQIDRGLGTTLAVTAAAVQGLGRNEPHVEGIRVLPPDDEVSFDPHAVSIAPTVSSPTGTREGGAATQVGFPDGRGPSRAWGLSAALGATS